MKRYTYERKIAYLLLHQICIIAMMICIYAYDYIVSHTPQKNEVIYLAIALIGLLGGIAFLLLASRIENRLNKKNFKKKIIDRCYPEILIIIVLVVIVFFGKVLTNLKVEDFSLAGLVIAIGILTYLMDTVFLIGFLGIVRKHAARILKLESITFFVYSLWKNRKTESGFRDISRRAKEQEKIREALGLIASGELDTTLNPKEFHGTELEMAHYINNIQKGLKGALEKRIKDEKMKADLITNVSHDIKTPLTSIVNYVNLLKQEDLQNETANNYIRIIDEKAQRLKQLTEDLVEVSRISSGNINLDMQKIDFLELLYQTGGEFNERFEERNLTIITKLPAAPVYIKADGRQLYRTIENLYVNAAKYAMENTNVYVELNPLDEIVVFTIKNISKNKIEVSTGEYEELTERFVRGEISRTTEGSGLGLSIAKSLVVHIQVDGETFMARLTFPLVNGN